MRTQLLTPFEILVITSLIVSNFINKSKIFYWE